MASTLGRSIGEWPIISRSAGRASNSKLTYELTGIAGQAEHRHDASVVGLQQPERERLRRLDGDLHPLHVAEPVEHHLDEVEVAHAHAAAREQRIARRHPSLHRFCDHALVVSGHAEVDGGGVRLRLTAASSIVRFDSRICPGVSSEPSSTNYKTQPNQATKT